MHHRRFLPMDQTIDQKVTKRHLDQAESDIAAGQERIEDQRSLIEKMRREGHDIAVAEQLLQTLEHSLGAMKHHRNVILEELGMYRAGESATHRAAGVRLPDKA